jgi:2'-5' RNA ligase
VGANWFVGVVLPPWTRSLGPLPPGVRALHPDDLHLTVAFLGSCTEVAARAAWDALTWPTGPLDVVLGPCRAFGGRYPSALAVTIDDPRLVDAIDAARGPCLDAAGLPPDDRPVRPHATFARIVRRATKAEARAARAWAEGLPTAGTPVRLDTLALFTWSPERSVPGAPRPARDFVHVRERRLGSG